MKIQKAFLFMLLVVAVNSASAQEIVQDFSDTVVKSYGAGMRPFAKKILIQIIKAENQNISPCGNISKINLQERFPKFNCEQTVKLYRDIKFKYSGQVFGQ